MTIDNDLFEIVSIFLNCKYDSNNAGNKIFLALQRFLHFSKGFISYINENQNTLKYTYNKNSKEEDSKTTYCLEETLYANECPFAYIKIIDNTPYNSSESKIFKTCSILISNILKEIELTEIMKMQVNALQTGIVEINKSNKLIKEQNKKILTADKIKNKFLSNVSHELRSPLNSIIGFSDLLISKAVGELNEKQTEYIKDIQIAGIHLLGMVNEVLDISKIESHSMKMNYSTFDLNLCINEVINILKPLSFKKELLVKNNIEINTKINADYQKLQQILFNLLSNAIKFTNPKGIIKIYSKKTKKYITISIKDNGIGIDKRNHKRIFKKFEQITTETNCTQNSTGLGLTITKELVKLHKGHIYVESELNYGSIFHVKLPLKNNSCHD